LARAGAALVLGVVIFVGFMFFLLLNNFSDNLLSADFYNDTISGQDTYNRIYTEVLVDDELREKTAELLGDIQVVSHEELVGLLRQVVPTEYMQEQVEGAIGRTIDYMNEDTDVLEAYIDLSVPLENVKPVMFGYIDGRIDALEVEEIQGIPDCTPAALSGLVDRYVATFTRLAEGVVPESVPSLKQIAEPCRVVLFELAFGSLVDDTTLSAEAKENLKAGKGELRLPFAAGDTLEVLKVSARLLATPLMDKAINNVRADLSDGDRLDLIRQVAEWDSSTTEVQIRSDVGDARRWVSRARNFGDLTTLLMVIGGAILLGLVHLPRLAGMLRWPGVALALTGTFFFVVGKIAQSEVPDRMRQLVDSGADQVSGVPPSVTDLGGDILVSFGTQMTNGIVWPSLVLLIIGVVLIGASFFTAPITKVLPYVR